MYPVKIISLYVCLSSSALQAIFAAREMVLHERFGSFGTLTELREMLQYVYLNCVTVHPLQSLQVGDSHLGRWMSCGSDQSQNLTGIVPAPDWMFLDPASSVSRSSQLRTVCLFPDP